MSRRHRGSVWRKLRRLGVVQIVDGLVGLPLDGRTREQLEWIADEVIGAGGEASVWIADAGSVRQQRAFIELMTDAVAAEYAAVIADAAAASDQPDVYRTRTVARLRRELRRIRARDFFPPPGAEAARVAVEALADATEEAVR